MGSRSLEWMLEGTEGVPKEEGDSRAKLYNLPLLFDAETQRFGSMPVDDVPSRLAWTLLAKNPHASRMNSVAKAVGRIFVCESAGSQLHPRQAVTGFYVAPNVIMTVAHIKKNDTDRMVFVCRANAQWDPTLLKFDENMWEMGFITSDKDLDVSLWHIGRSSDIHLSISSRVLNILENWSELQSNKALATQDPIEKENSAVFSIGYNIATDPDKSLEGVIQADNLKDKVIAQVTPTNYSKWLNPNRKTASPGNIVGSSGHAFAVTCSYNEGYDGAPLLFVTESELAFFGYVALGAPKMNFNFCYSTQTPQFKNWFTTLEHRNGHTIRGNTSI